MYGHYDVRIGGQKADVYRICKEYDVTEPAIFQAIKKLLRLGEAHKGRVQDVVEARDGLNRWLEMEDEDASEEHGKRCAPVPDDFKEVCKKIMTDVRK